MAKKLFEEIDDWDDSGVVDFNFSSNKKVLFVYNIIKIQNTSISFQKPEKKEIEEKSIKKSKTKKRKNNEDNDQEADSVGGRFVKAPKFSNDEMEPPAELSKSKSKKRKQDQINQEESNQTKKLKKSDKTNDSSSSNSSFADKLRENLKGSRFRFINEQMYKTTGSDAKKLFKDDPGLFEAYHEGYRHQIAQWPMNPLDRIINGIKRM